MSIRSYKDLVVWQKGITFVETVYQVTEEFPRGEQYGLTNQLRRSAVSVPSNIAEGQARQHTGEFRHFLYIALGSLAEAHTQIIIAERLAYLNEQNHKNLMVQMNELQKMLHALAKKLSTNH